MDKTLDFLEKQSKVEQIIETESESLTESETAAAGQTAETPAGQVSGTAAAAHTAETQTSETVKQVPLTRYPGNAGHFLKKGPVSLQISESQKLFRRICG